MSDRALKILLGVSLVANVFIVGGVVGALYMRVNQPPSPAQRPAPLAGAADALSATDRDAFRAMIRAQIPVIRPLQQDARAARRDALAGLAAPAFDRAAVGALMARARDDEAKARGHMEESVLDFAAKLPVNERLALVSGMRRGAMERRMMMKGPRPEGPPPSDGPRPDAPPPPP